MAQPAAPNLPLTASYASPISAPFTISNPIPAPPTSSAEDKSQYLRALRAAVATAQDHINKELTARMDEDKAREAAAGARPSVDEDKEEENYGEEVQEEED